MAAHPLRAERRRLHFVGSQHERRQVEAALEHIANPGLAANRHPLADQRGDVAINGAPRRFEFGRNRRGGDRPF